MTKVLVITEQYWPEGGGGILATHLITKILAQHGAKVTVATGTDQPSQIEKVEYFTIPHLKPRNKVELWINLALLRRVSSFMKILRDVDIVYIPRYSYPIISLAKNIGKRVIVHLHDYQPIAYNAAILHFYQNSNSNSNPLDLIRENVRYELMEHRSLSRAAASTLLLPSNALTRHWLKEADEVLCVSKKQAEIISGKLNINVKVVYNPLPETHPVTKEVSQSFLYTGGTSYLKGMHVLLEASKRLLRRNGAARFVVTKGIQTVWQRALTDNLAAAYQILGWVDYKELSRLHSSILALIFPSIWEEPLPYTVLEAMLHGTIPIASKVGGVPEIVEGSYAEKMLFQPGDVEELVNKMEDILTINNEQIADVSYALRESLLKRFDPETTRNTLMELFLHN